MSRFFKNCGHLSKVTACNLLPILALVSSHKSDLQYPLDRFSDACLDAGMKISTNKTEIKRMPRHPVQCFFQTKGVTLQQTEKFKYFGVIFSSDGRQDNQMDTHIGN